MKIDVRGLYNLTGAGQTEETKRVDETKPKTSTSASPSAPTPSLQSVVLVPAKNALSNMQDIDYARVMTLRDALARGEVPFRTDRLAALIQYHHGKSE